MAYRIIWTERASDDLGAIVRFISRHNREAAASVGFGIYDRAQILAEFPEAGSPVREVADPDWRHLVFRSWRIAYHLNRREHWLKSSVYGTALGAKSNFSP
jgi:toxin ParE1/3/4